MRKTVLLLTVFALLVGGAFAQDDQVVVITEPESIESYWATVALGYPLGLSFGVGVNDLINNDIDARGLLSVAFDGDFGIGADLLFDIPANVGTDIDLYAGGGPALTFGGDFLLGIKLFAGGEYRLGGIGLPEGGVYAELGPTLRFAPNFGGGLNTRVGVNYHF